MNIIKNKNKENTLLNNDVVFRIDEILFGFDHHRKFLYNDKLLSTCSFKKELLKNTHSIYFLCKKRRERTGNDVCCR